MIEAFPLLFNDSQSAEARAIAGGFQVEWTVSGDAAARTVTLPLTNNGTFACTVYWGDGESSTITTYDDADRAHTYAGNGVYVMSIVGECPGWSFNNGGDKAKCTDIISWGDSAYFGGFTYLTGGFYGCANLKTTGRSGMIIPKVGLTTVNTIFRGCTSITTISSGLFSACVGLTASAFYGICIGCTALVSIPVDLFRYAINATTSAFHYSFSGCTALTTVPADTFKYNTAVSTNAFNECFSNCGALAAVSADLFRFNTAASSDGFYYTFNNCTKLQQRADIFFAAGEETTRFLNRVSDFQGTFRRVSFTGTQGVAPALWACDFGTETPTTTDCWDGAGNSLTSLSNYGDIPAGWK